MRETFFLNSVLFSRHSLAASMFAGDSSLGDDSMLIIESTILSTCRGWRDDLKLDGDRRQCYLVAAFGSTDSSLCAQGSTAQPRSPVDSAGRSPVGAE